MQGLMQRHPLLLSSIITHAARHHGEAEVVSVLEDRGLHRTTYAALEPRARQALAMLRGLGVRLGDRVATLAWNGYRHVELYYGISGLGAVCHTVNPRLALDDIAYIMNHAEDSVLFADLGFAALVEQALPLVPSIRQVVMLCTAAELPALALPPGVALLAYEALMEAEEPAPAWPIFDENTASALCYTSGTTGRPKGVLYAHRSAVLHAMTANMADLFGLRAVDRYLLCASMFHATGWAVPYCAPMVGAALVLPGRHMDGATLTRLLNEERITFSGGVPTIWLSVLAHMRETGTRPEALKRLLVAGSACPRVLIEGFGAWGVDVHQGWGMTETSPLVTYHGAKPATAALAQEDDVRLRLKQGRAVFGTDIKIVDAEGRELPRDGVAFGDLLARGHWVAQEYLGRGAEGAADAEGWFRTGDVATIDPNGYAEMVDRSKDVIKSGGEWISTIALENIAVSHPDVAEAAVIAARHPRWMERPLLLVVPKEGRRIDPESVLALYEGQVAKWWLPDAVVTVEELPHTATGKLNKLALRASWQDYLEKRQAAE
ncbi:MAG: long-chain-fatty-acid--CoA ligase [Acetobacteraceae bacterium]|nr:long-chain-fatty-acid--CoA ligase [Acetobacteraceae bacterium]